MKKYLLAALLLLTALPIFAQAQNAWTNTFSIEIFDRPLPALSTNSLSITVLKDSTASGSISLLNQGNQPISFTSAGVAATSMDATWIRPTSGWVDFGNAPYDRARLDSFDTDLPLGFSFPYIGTTNTSIQIEANGRIKLIPSFKFLMPFYDSNVSIDPNNIGYLQEEDRMVVSWEGASKTDGSLTNLHFQVQIFKNGDVLYLYQTMDGATINDATSIGHTEDPTAGELAEVKDGATVLTDGSALLLTPRTWITPSPSEGSVPTGSSIPWTFFVDGSDSAAQSGTNYNFIVNWSDGSASNVTVAVIVEALNPLLNVSPLTTSPFNGQAGFIAKNSVTLTNAGNVELNYSFLDPEARTSGYTWTRTLFNWNENANFEFTPQHKDSGYYEPMSLGFAFPYFGTIYTNFSISVDGFLSLGAGGPDAEQIIAPFWQDLYYDSNSRIYASGDRRLQVITWENMSSADGDDQTFQLILGQNGTITFQYLELNGTNDWISSDIGSSKGIGLKDTSSRIVNNTLIWSAGPDDNSGTVITNVVVTEEQIPNPDRDYGTITVRSTNNVVTYDNPLRSQAFSYIPAATPITVSPVLGSLAPGQTQVITITGDARDLSAGVSKSFDILSEAPTKNLTVDFILSAPSSAELMLDSDGDGQSDHAELLAGTDEQNAASAFNTNLDGSRTITWTEPETDDHLNRTYTIWFTTNLLDGWEEEPLAVVENLTRYEDTEHNDATAIYYKVTID